MTPCCMENISTFEMGCKARLLVNYAESSLSWLGLVVHHYVYVLLGGYPC